MVTLEMKDHASVALVAHELHERVYIECVASHQDRLIQPTLCARGKIGQLCEQAAEPQMTKLQRVPLGGDQTR